MNKNIKEDIKNAFEAPQPQRKSDFLKRFPLLSRSSYSSIVSSPCRKSAITAKEAAECKKAQPLEMSLSDFILSQFFYIRKRVWTISILLIVIAFLGSAAMPGNALWIISALTPVMAAAIVAESGRSERYGMTELEMSARFSLRSVIFSRLIITGIMDIFVFAILWAIALHIGSEPPLRAGIYILCPYFVTSYLCLCVTRKMRSQNSLYVCAAIAAAISAVPLVVPYISNSFGFAEYHFMWITVIFLLSIAGAANEYLKIIKTEEYEWNL